MLWEKFATSIESQLDWSFYSPFLPSVSFCCPQIRFTNNVITTLLDQDKATIFAHNWMIRSPTVRSEAWTLLTPFFPPVANKLTAFTTDTNKVIGKPVGSLQWFIIRHYVNLIDKCLFFRCSHLAKILICLQCDSIQCLKWFLVWG